MLDKNFFILFKKNMYNIKYKYIIFIYFYKLMYLLKINHKNIKNF